MFSDKERREVARRLRGLEVCELDGKFIDCGEVEVAVGLVSDDGAWYEAESVTRLADLIEPTNGFDIDHMAQVCFECLEGCDEPEYTLYETILTAISRYKRGESGLPSAALVDRDALLELADEMETAEVAYTITADASHPDEVVLKGYEDDWPVNADKLTHTKPEQDSWEKWRDEFIKPPCVYCRDILGLEFDDDTELGRAFDAQIQDMERRARALAERGE